MLQQTKLDASGIRVSFANDWGSHTGFTYTMGFVKKDEQVASDESIPLADGGVVYIDRKAIWAGEGGLLGALIDLDEHGNLKVTPKEPKS